MDLWSLAPRTAGAGGLRGCARRALVALWAGAVAIPGASCAMEGYPARAIRLVVPFSAGDGSGATGRLIAEKLGKDLGRHVLVERRAGAGARAVGNSRADGYTLLLADTGSLTVVPHLDRRGGFDPRRDLAAAGMIGRVPLVMVVHAQAPFRTMKHLIDLARIAPGTLNHASSGPGSLSHLAAELFASAAGIELAHVPSADARRSVNSVLARKADVVFSVAQAVRGEVRAGKLRAVALAGPERSTILPGVPTAAEEGLRGFEAVLNYGVVAPAGTPSGAIARLNGGLNAVLRADDVRGALAAHGVTPVPGSPGEYAKVIARDVEKWGRLVRESAARGPY